MPKLILHVGTGKTGTTSIQVALRANELALQSRGFHLLRAIRAVPHSGKHKMAWKDPADRRWEEIAEEARQVRTTGRHVLISNESLWMQEPETLRRLASLFEGYQPEVVLYVREQAEYLQSMVLQKQKKPEQAFDFHDPERIASWLDRRNLDYHAACVRMEEALGQGTVNARLYDRSALVGGDVLVDFFTVLGIAELEALDLRPPSNPSIAAEFSDILRRLHQADVVRGDRGAGGPRGARTADEEGRQHRRGEAPRSSEDRAARRSARGGAQTKVRFGHLQDLAARLSANGYGSRHFLPREQVEVIRQAYTESNHALASTYLRNADAVPMRPAWAGTSPHTQQELEAILLEAAGRLPTLGPQGWAGARRTGKQILVEGWRFRVEERQLEATIVGEQAKIAFRIPFRRRDRFDGDIPVTLTTAGDARLAVHVEVNGRDVGVVDLPAQVIHVPIEWCGPLDEVELVLRPLPGTRPVPITGLSLGATRRRSAA